MSRPVGFYVPYQEDDGTFGSAKGSYGRDIAKTQFIPLTAIETIYQVNGGYWRLRTLAGNTYDFGAMDDEISPDTPAIEELIGVINFSRENHGACPVAFAAKICNKNRFICWF